MIIHPLGEEKKKYIHLFLDNPQKKTIGALFPEIYFHTNNNEYSNQVVKKFQLKHLKEGDKTTFILQEGKEIIENLQQLNSSNDLYTFKKIQLIEDMEPETAIRFLSSHYYYHSMYKWFWIYFNLNDKKENSVLYNHAAEIAFCENKSMKIVTDYFSLAISYSRNEMQIQRLWHQLSVFLTLRGELSAAKDAIEKCKDLLKHVTDLNERICRTVEYYNSLALIYFKEKDYEKAATILNSAEKTLEIINIQNKRSLDIKRILEVNKKKLEKLIVQTIRRETF